MAKQKCQARTRNYATVVYPDSAPVDWQEILSQQFIPAFVSPLHDQDINPDGEQKKSHYHVMIMYDSVKTMDQARAVFDAIGGVGCEVVQSLRGYARYLCHLDNPDKHQYNTDDIRSFCGADYPSMIGLPTDKYKAIREIIMYCNDNNLYSYSDLIDICSTDHYDWFRVLCDSGTYVIKEYLKSKTYTDRIKGLQEEFIAKSVMAKIKDIDDKE